ncbi:hypothetical protein L9F63_006700, partial [Diploptera punctata]
ETPGEDYEDDSDMYLEPSEPQGNDAAGMEQHFFPSFAPVFPAPPLGHSRPAIFQEPAHSERPTLFRPQHNIFQPLNFAAAGTFRENPYVQTAATATGSGGSGILGSGNFRVIRGGTFYGDDDEKEDYAGRGNQQFYNPYYYNNNGHGRPAFYNGASNPRPQNHRGTDFFANFRDFADINTPTKSSFSEYVVVYVNRNTSNHNNETDGKNLEVINSKPKNIIERLAMLDEQDYPRKKPSQAKLKLAKYEDVLNKQKNKKTKEITSSSKDLYEPLLALS